MTDSSLTSKLHKRQENIVNDVAKINKNFQLFRIQSYFLENNLEKITEGPGYGATVFANKP